MLYYFKKEDYSFLFVFFEKEMISIEINNIIYRSYNFRRIKKIENNILLEKISKKDIQFNNEKVLELLKKYGMEILKILHKNFSANLENQNSISLDKLLNLFIQIYQEIGYIYSDKDICDKNNSYILVTSESILDLSEKIIRTYLLYELYKLLENGITSDKTITTNMNILFPNYKYENFSKLVLLNTINNELEKYENNKNKIYLERISNFYSAYSLNDLTEFNIVSSNFCCLSLYILINNLSVIQEIGKHAYIKCKHCGKITVRECNSQKYCSECQCHTTYNNKAKGTKQQIIKTLQHNIDKIHFEDEELNKKLIQYASLNNAGKSRERENTPKKKLLEFYELAKKQYKYEHNK